MKRKKLLLVTLPLLALTLLTTLSVSRYKHHSVSAERLDVQITNRLVCPLIAVKGGTFKMGATEEQTEYAESDEKPAHRVTLDTYFIGVYEVTQKLWKDVMKTNPSKHVGDNLPVENVSWNDCQEFIKKLNRRRSEINLGSYSNWVFRLPTEAEWEYAARGGNQSNGYRYSGSNRPADAGWYSSNSDFETHEVGSKVKNELGLYDMSGNVWEWCQDTYSSTYYSNSPQRNPLCREQSDSRVSRGGGYSFAFKYLRISYRGRDDATGKYANTGFRLVLAPAR